MKTSTAVLTTLSLFAAGGIGYAVYWDHKRRNDPAFRKELRKNSKRSTKLSKKESARKAKEEEAIVNQLLENIRLPGGLPTGIEEKEKYFLEHVAMGEQLFAQGPSQHLAASIAFFKALKVYPSPVELIMIYQKAVPKEVFDCIMRIVSKDIALGGDPETEAGPSQPAGNLDDVDEVGPSGVSEIPLAQETKQEEDKEKEQGKEEAKEGEEKQQDSSSTSEATTATAPAADPEETDVSKSAPASTSSAPVNNGTDSGTTSSQEWDTLSSTSINESGVVVPTPNVASSTETEVAAEEPATAPAAEEKEEPVSEKGESEDKKEEVPEEKQVAEESAEVKEDESATTESTPINTSSDFTPAPVFRDIGKQASVEEDKETTEEQ
ncbi:MAS20-domain-containing protein [Violaceomyces palustris]|uniref:MAS20-domain-containing protein n=1 Tax=Violaceomyces palustris TaxID=1673888 RepID=A0ACD0NYH3_9BASI|nr:MAS20-domain-containing protein [Violaceomyces palustris]